MKWHTHTLLGINSLWLLIPFLSHSDMANIGLLAAGAAFGALIPDLDAAESKIKHLRLSGVKPFQLPSTILHQTLGHRGLLHSLVGLSLVATATIPLSFTIGWQMSLALTLGYASHLAADASTRSGIPVVYPCRNRYHLLPRSCRFVTGSQAEEVLFVLAAAGVALLLLRPLAI